MKVKKTLIPFVLGVLITLTIGMLLISTENAVLISSIKYDRLMSMDKKYEKAEKIKEEILEEFYLDVTEEDLEIGMYRGMFDATGDKYSRYFTKEELEEYNDSTNGNYVGIGVLSDVSEGEIHITRVFPESPAEKAGIMAGDFIVEVDGETLKDNGYEKLIDIMLGEEGTDIEVIVNRDSEELIFKLKRGRVDIPFITSTNIDGIGYIHIYQFGTDVSKEFKSHLKALENENIKGLIVDVRDNPGGLVTESTDIADLLMGDGVIIYTLDNEDNKRTYKSDSSKISIPVVCLANGKSASASEILIGALQDSDSAVVVGEQSFGKGIVQGITSLTDGSGYKITYSQYYTPTDNVIHKVGVTPDYIVPFEGNIDILAPNPDKDPQLKQALKVMEDLVLSK